MIELICAVCKSPFQVRNYRKDTAKFCGYVCMGKDSYERKLKNVRPPSLIGNTYRKGLKPTNAFPKGHEPWNKNLKGIHLSPETEFKKGESIRRVPIGTISIHTDRKGIKRYRQKIGEPSQWKLHAVIVWESANNCAVPKGSVIHHKDRNPLNDDISNLQLLTRGEHLKEHRKDFEEQRMAGVKRPRHQKDSLD